VVKISALLAEVYGEGIQIFLCGVNYMAPYINNFCTPTIPYISLNVCFVLSQ
jgi:hypothetical protein